MQKFFGEHLPSLTEGKRGEAGPSATDYLTDLVFRAIAGPEAESGTRTASRSASRGRGTR